MSSISIVTDAVTKVMAGLVKTQNYTFRKVAILTGTTKTTPHTSMQRLSMPGDYVVAFD